MEKEKQISQVPLELVSSQKLSRKQIAPQLDWFQMLACIVWEDDPDVSKRISLSLVRCNSVALNSQVRT